MSALEQVNLTTLENQAFALMSRLHVILRRQNGRITDIEYMRIDPGYCRHVLDLAARMDGDDLAQICEKLEALYFGPDGLFVRTPPKPPLLARLAPQQAAEKPRQPQADEERAYVGRLR
ncbi:hypothetical protein [Noviherbaspirillum aridicola]|uniref:Uncharacterized protein n=1 Tax=Noviherbaspirillum aridicola TaxID=2849687 RepID=A0ABQ4Q2J2_9BURK|nr:hypothetical protein [Noviherbaspirillum aridicola]GIZ51402.1 hypothetical protein NCCP691_14160 [Noviherbaspirillum aridicola]